jgi:hypothetical protein
LTGEEFVFLGRLDGGEIIGVDEFATETADLKGEKRESHFKKQSNNWGKN